MKAESILQAHALLGEGPVWLPEEQRLYWLDIDGRRLHRFDPVSGDDESFILSGEPGCLVPTNTGTFLLALESGIEEIRPEQGELKTLRTLAHPEHDLTGNRYNDGKCSPEGRFWFGSLNRQRQTGRASLYVLDDRGCRQALAGATNSNGLGWSPDGTILYWIDTPTRRVDAFDYDSRQGALSNRRTVLFFPDLSTEEGRAMGRPDGMTVDAEGMLWIAHWLGGRITRWDPGESRILETVHLPVARVTSLTFGGPDLDTLYITTAGKDLAPEEQAAGSEAGNLFSYRPKTPGLPVARFRYGA